MNLKQQVVNLKYAKKLKKLGVKQKSLFYWTKAFYADGFNLSWGLEYKEMNKLRFFEYGDKKIKAGLFSSDLCCGQRDSDAHSR